MSEYGGYDAGFPGMKAGIEDTRAEAGAARAPIAFGTPSFRKEGDERGLYPFIADTQTATISADFIASNSTIATVNGVATAAVVYATSHAVTFAAVVAAIEALTGVDVVSSNATARTITVKTYGTDGLPTTTTLAIVTTLGASQPTVAYQFGTTLKLAGVSMHQHKGAIAGLVRYETKDPASVMTRGKIYVTSADTIISQKTAYLTSAGAWTDEVTGNLATPYIFRSGTSGAGLAVLAVN